MQITSFPLVSMSMHGVIGWLDISNELYDWRDRRLQVTDLAGSGFRRPKYQSFWLVGLLLGLAELISGTYLYHQPHLTRSLLAVSLFANIFPNGSP
jgi:hypothetical protein